MSHFVGIDWAMEKHDICIQTGDGRVITEMTISHNLEGFQTLRCHLDHLDDVKILIERSDGLLVDWLLQQGWSVYMLHPTILNRRRPRRSKDDRGDAFLLAYLLRVGDPDCRPITRSSPLVQSLKQAALSYDNTLISQRQYTNRLIYTLRQFYPTVILAFPSVNSLTCLDFLEQYPTPSTARALSIDELDEFLRQHHYSARTKCLPGIYAGLHAEMPDAAFPDALVVRLQTLIPIVRCFTLERPLAEKRMLSLFDQHPEADWWRGFPGAGPLTAARLLAYIGDDRSHFPSPEVLQAIAGTAPVTRRSGKQLHVEFRRACVKSLRKTVIDLARNSIPKSGWARSYYNQQLSYGHTSSRAFRALGNRWLAIMWKLWQTNEPYNEAVHVANRSKRGNRLTA